MKTLNRESQELEVTRCESIAVSPRRSGTFRRLLVLVSLLAALRPGVAQYSLDWWTGDGGGGTSTGDVYTVSGTIGQPDAGTLSGGGYSLTGGFWALYAVQTPGAPLLGIILTSTNTVMVHWPSPSTGFSLQVNTNLTTTNWVPPGEDIQDNGTLKYLIVNPPAGNRFYRLQNP